MNNTSEHHDSSHDEEDPLFGFEPTFVYPVATFYILIVTVAVVGNLMVCYAIIANRNLRNNPTNLLLLSLAVSDLLTVTLAVPFDIEGLFLNGVWKHGKAMCITWITVYLITVPTSILTLLAISVDRFKTLSDPLARFRRSRFMTPNVALIIILILWLYSIFWAFLPLMGWLEKGQEPIYKGSCMVPFTKVYTTLTTILNWIAPLMITCVFYILIYLIARKHHKFTNRGGLPSTKQPSKDENKAYLKNIKAAKTTAMFVVAFFICWLPYSFFSIASNLTHWEPFPFKVYVVLLMLGYLNSALNPFLFAFRNKRFKAVYSKLFRRLKRNPTGSSLRRQSTFSQTTSTSEIPDLDSNVVRLQSIKIKRGESSPKWFKRSKN
ncbi:hypothetical protein ACROYT_G003210 [Oculina patagonica]